MSDYPTAYDVYLAQRQATSQIQCDLEQLYKNTLSQSLQNLPSDWKATIVWPIKPLSDEDREAEIRENNIENPEEDYDEVFLLRKLDEARAEIDRLRTLAPSQPEPVTVLSGPFWKQSEE